MIRSLVQLPRRAAQVARRMLGRGNGPMFVLRPLTSRPAALADNLLARRGPLPEGAFGLLAHEIRFYNHYIQSRESVDLTESRSQLGYDLWVAYLTDGPGYFVEFGAFDGKNLSNTYYLERSRGWKGIVAEPNPVQYQHCRENRSCIVDPRCVWRATGEQLEFNTVEGENELGTLTAFEANDLRGGVRASQRSQIKVETVSLADLLSQHGAPSEIDYISIDTEGSELAILEAFPFERIAVKTLSVEHNYSPQRKQVHELLSKHGFFRLRRSVDYFDDLYLHGAWFPRDQWG